MKQADYTALEQFFAEHGEVIHIGGNSPLIVTDEQSVWYIQTGHIDMFAIAVRAGEIISGRRFLLSLGPGRIVFGYYYDATATLDTLGHLVAGPAGTTLLRADRSQLFRAAAGNELHTALGWQIQAWAHALSTALKLADGVQGAMPDGAQDAAPDGVPDGVPGGVQGAMPDGAQDAASDGTPDAAPDRLSDGVQGAVPDGPLSEVQLSGFHQRVHLHYLHNRAAAAEAELQTLRRKQENDRAVMEHALKRLAAVTGTRRPAGPDPASANPLQAACKLVAEAAGMRLKPANASRLRKAGDPVALIAGASGFRSRRVILAGQWWRDDNGPLLGFMAGTRLPVALIQKTPKSYAMVDPETGAEQAVTAQVAQSLDPIAYMFYRPLPAKPLKVMDIVRFSWHKSLKRDIGMLLLMGVAGGLLGMFMPIANGMLFDTIIPASDQGLLLQMGFILLSVTASLFLLELTQSMALLRLEGKLDSSIQAAVWDRLLSLPVSFFRGYSAGDLSMRANSINAIRQSLSGVALTAIFGGLFSSFNFFLLFYYDVNMALAAAAMAFLAAAVTVGAGIWQVKQQRVLLRLEGRLSGLIFQLINGIAKFRMATAERRAFFLWAKQFSEMKETDFRVRTLTNVHAVFIAFFPAAAAVVLFYMMAAGSSTMSPGQFIAFFAAFSAFLGANLSMSSAIVSSLAIVPLYERAKPILLAAPEVPESREDPGELAGEIEVKHVHFRYRQDQQPILNDISLHIYPGEFVALVGASGCGKSTLFRLLLGFENPESGAIALDGQDLKSLDIHAVRSQFGVVLQNAKVMTGDIFTNIAGSSNLTIDGAWEAAAMAGLDEDIRQMPMGMHTMVSEGGSTLSGGQRQRMMIARAIAGKPKILLFDEATSALDNRTQAIVSESLESLKATRIVIAHRLSTIRNADRIFVFDQGRVAQAGTYEELLHQEGLFSTLAHRQLA